VISTLNPADEATGVFLGASPVATFSEPIVRGTGNITIKNLTDSTQTTIPVTDTTQVSISGTVLTINPTADLLGGKDYAVQIAATAIKDLANNAFVGITNDTTWNFATATAPNAPGVVTGLALWLDASDPSTMTLNGSSTVTEWRDKAGSLAKMTLNTGTPTAVASGIGGIPTVHFTNGSSMVDGVNHAAPVTIFYVSRQTGGSNRRVLGAANNNWLLGYWGGNKGSAWFEGDVNLSGNGPSDTAPHLYAATIPGSGQNSTVWAEGVQIASNQGGTQGPNGLFLGGDGQWGEYSDCDISEVLVYHRVLTPVEANLVGYYLSGKYGLDTSYDPPPTISTLSPVDNATGVAVSANLVATFSENIARGTGNITIKNLTDGTQTTIAVTDAQVTISGATLTINPTADLLGGKNYAVQIAATAVKDLANNAFAGITNDTGWNFTTLTDFAVWAAKFGGANLTDPNADFDGDRTSNDHERIWGLNPTNAASRNPFTSTSNLAVGNFSYTRRIPSLTGYSYTVWTSTNLTTWAQDTGAVQAPGAPVAEVETVTVNLSPALLGGPRLFVRMRAA
jgi:hypothetical protein